MAKRYSKAAHLKRRKQTSHVLKNTVILLFCAVGIWFGSSLWHAALTLQTAQPAESIAGEEFRPQVGDPPYRVVIDAGHGGADPGARGVIEEKDMTAATASELIRPACRQSGRTGTAAAAFHPRQLSCKWLHCIRL